MTPTVTPRSVGNLDGIVGYLNSIGGSSEVESLSGTVLVLKNGYLLDVSGSAYVMSHLPGDIATVILATSMYFEGDKWIQVNTVGGPLFVWGLLADATPTQPVASTQTPAPSASVSQASPASPTVSVTPRFIKPTRTPTPTPTPTGLWKVIDKNTPTATPFQPIYPTSAP